MLYESETCHVKEEDMIRLERNGTRMVRWMFNVRPEDRISIEEELMTRLKLKSVRECLHDRRLQWFGQLERMKQSAWSCECRAFKVSDTFPRGRQGKTWNEVT